MNPMRIVFSGLLALAVLPPLVAADEHGGLKAAPATPAGGAVFGDALKRYNIKDAEQRKYIEDNVKQQLQDEISKHIDLKLDVEVYLKSLDHLANGEVKEANNYLMEEVGKKLLEWAVGSTGAKILVAAWDFDKFVWTSVQDWAEKRDQQVFHDWLKGRVDDWRHGRNIHQMLTDQDARRVFDLWWHDEMEKFGKTKMYGDRQNYYVDFENACRHRFMDVVAKNRQAHEERENLKLAIRAKQFEIAMKIAYEEGQYKRAIRAIRRAGLKAEGNAQIKRYWSDPVFQKMVDDLAVKNNTKSTLELEKKVLASAEDDLATAGQATEQARIAQSEGRIAIVSPPLGALSTFRADYQTILQILFSNSVAPEEGVLALRRWEGLNLSFVIQLNRTRDTYLRMSAKDQAQRNQLQAEAARIEQAIKAHNEAIAGIRRTYDERALSAYEGLRRPEARLQELRATQLHLRDYDEQIQTLWADAQKIPADEAGNPANGLINGLANEVTLGTDGLTDGVRGLVALILTDQYRTDSTPPSAQYVVNESVDPKAAMDRLARWIDRVAAAYRVRIDRNIREFTLIHDADQAVLTQIKQAIDEFESVYESQAGAIEYAAEWCKPKNAINRSLEGWRHFYMATDGELNHNVEKAILKRGFHHKRLSNIHGFGTAMGLHFAQELEMLSRAQLLAADAAQLRTKYGSAKLPPDGSLPDDDVTQQAIAILRNANSKAVFDQMFSRYQSVRDMLDGQRSGYDRVLTPAVQARLGLDQPPYEGWRRPTELNNRILVAMEELIDETGAADRADGRDEPIRVRCVKILAEFEELARKPRLLNKEIGLLHQQAEKDILAVQGAIGKPRLIVQDVTQATATRDAFKAFANQCAALQASDDRDVANLLAKARSQVIGTGGTPAARNTALQRALEYIDLAERHARVLAVHAPYAGQYRHDNAIREARSQLGSGAGADIGTTMVQTDPAQFKKEGAFHVSLNGKIFEQVPGTVYSIASQGGELTIRSENCDGVFVDARKVMLRLWTGPTAPKDFVTVAEGRIAFVYTTRIESGKPYALELRIITSDDLGYEPKTFPLSFQWNGQPAQPGGTVAVDDAGKDMPPPREPKPSAAQAYKEYMDAHNAMARLMAAGKGGTPEGRQAYADFAKAKAKYDASVEQPLPEGGVDPTGTPAPGDATGNFDQAIARPCASDEDFVRSLYHCITHREPTLQEIQEQIGRLRNGALRQHMIAYFFASPGYVNQNHDGARFMTDACQAIYARPPTEAELQSRPRTHRSVIIAEMFKNPAHLAATKDCEALWRKKPSGDSPAVVPDNASGKTQDAGIPGMKDWDVSQVTLKPSGKGLMWDSGNFRSISWRHPISMENVVIEFDGWCATNGLGLYWTNDEKLGYFITLGGWFNTRSCSDALFRGIGTPVEQREYVDGAHIQLGRWQRYKIVRSGDWLDCYVDGTRIIHRQITSRYKGKGTLSFSSWGSAIGVDNLKIY